MAILQAGKKSLNPKNLLPRGLAITAFCTVDSLMKGESRPCNRSVPVISVTAIERHRPAAKQLAEIGGFETAE